MRELISQGGTIQVTEDGIQVSHYQRFEGGSESLGTATYKSCSIENLQDAARVLAAWMDIPYEDREMEIQRIHVRDQSDSALRDACRQAMDDLQGEGDER